MIHSPDSPAVVRPLSHRATIRLLVPVWRLRWALGSFALAAIISLAAIRLGHPSAGVTAPQASVPGMAAASPQPSQPANEACYRFDFNSAGGAPSERLEVRIYVDSQASPPVTCQCRGQTDDPAAGADQRPWTTGKPQPLTR